MSTSMPLSNPAKLEASLSETPSNAAEDAALLTAPGMWRRMACWLYEGMLMFAVVFVAGWLFSTLGQMRDAMDERRHLLQLEPRGCRG